jgi:CDP-glycerol glycerophosphotransferase (TagB/SpsB family)
VYRPHPWGKGGYKGERLLDYSWRHVRIERSMRSYLENVRAGKRSIYLADYADTHDVLSSVDALVSPLSTILLEGALHGKPVLCFIPDEREGSSLKLQARLVHFDAMYDDPLFLKAHGDAALVNKVAELMTFAADTQIADKMRRASKHFVETETASYPARLRLFVEEVVAQRAGTRTPGVGRAS